ncbi:hypothetical protein ACJZ2D_007546 [Fusarium nematophilum]
MASIIEQPSSPASETFTEASSCCSESPTARLASADADALTIACVPIYLEHIYYNIPVLDAVSLLSAAKQNNAPFQSSNPLRYALVAICLPWVNKSYFRRHGWVSREDALRSIMDEFEEHFYTLDGVPPLFLVQSLLLMSQAAAYGSVRMSQFKGREWLRLAISNLPQALLNLRYSTETSKGSFRENGSLSKRLWWACFLAEQSQMLRCLENRSKHPVSCLLDPKAAEPLLLSDMDQSVHWPPDTLLPHHWTCMERAACFVERTRLGLQTAELLTPRQQDCVAKTQSNNFIQHNNEFWRLQELIERYARYQKNAHRTSLEVVGDAVLSCLRLELDLMFHRTMVVLAQSLSRRRSDSQDIYLWHRFLQTRVIESVRHILHLGEQAIQPWKLATTDCRSMASLLRSLIVAAQSVIKPPQTSTLSNDAGTSQQRKLKARFDTVLSQCLGEHDSFWIKPFIFEEPYSPGLYEMDLTEESTPASAVDEVPTPRYETEQSYATEKDCHGHEEMHLLGQQSLMNSFDDMWNKYVGAL